MNAKEIIKDKYTFGDLETINDWFDGDTDFTQYCEKTLSEIKAKTKLEDTNEIIIIIKTLIIERLNNAICSVRNSTYF